MNFSKSIPQNYHKTFDGKICVVSGAASGIGRALCLRLAQAGATLALCDIDKDGMYETAHLIQNQNGKTGQAAQNNIMIDEIDMAQARAIADYAPRVEKQLGAADYVFNVAGLSRIGTFEETPLPAMETVMDVNFWGVVHMSKAFLPQIKANQGGLINISSVFGLVGVAGQSHYCASKFAVRGFTESLSAELAPLGVRVTSVHPGGVATNIVRNAKIDHLPEHIKSQEDLITNFETMAGTSAPDAADIILVGTVKGKRRILIGRDARMLDRIQRLFPTRYGNVLAKLSGRRGTLGANKK